MKNKNGITLISLIITIIVMLILAAVAIAMATGDSGIIKKAVNAKGNYLAAEQEEIMQERLFEIMYDQNNTNNNNIVRRMIESSDEDDIFKIIEKNQKINEFITTIAGKAPEEIVCYPNESVEFVVDGQKYILSIDGKIKAKK